MTSPATGSLQLASSSGQCGIMAESGMICSLTWRERFALDTRHWAASLLLDNGVVLGFDDLRAHSFKLGPFIYHLPFLTSRHHEQRFR